MSGKAVRETLAALGVIASMVFVGVEIRQNTIATRADTAQAVYDSGVALNLNVMNNEQLRDLLVLGYEEPDQLSELNSADHLLLLRFHQARFNHMENAFAHHQEGTLTDAMWAGYDGWIRSNVANPMDRRFWNEVSGSYVQGFREYIEPLLEGDG